MNIGIFSDTYFPQLNGVATSIRTLTHALREKGHTVYIFTPSDPRCEGQPEDEDIFRLPSIPVYFVRDYRAGYIFPPHILKKIKKLKLPQEANEKLENELKRLSKTNPQSPAVSGKEHAP